jgi:hypothetical protein
MVWHGIAIDVTTLRDMRSRADREIDAVGEPGR